MDDHRRQQLVEQYEDIALTLLMDDFANEDGAKLLQEFEEARRSGEITEIPAELDEKCRDSITRVFARQERRLLLTRIIKYAAKAVAVILVFLGLSAVTVLSVDALRIPVLNFLLNQTERYTTLTTDDQDLTEQMQKRIVDKMLGTPVPRGYQLVSQGLNDDGSVMLLYQDGEGHIISFQSVPSSSKTNVDTENVDAIELDLNGYDAVLIVKDGFRLIWMDPELKMTFDLYSDALEADSFWELAYRLAE